MTHRQQVEQAHESFWAGNFAAADTGLEQASRRPRRDLTVLQLDRAMVCLGQGDLGQATLLLDQAGEAMQCQPAMLDPGNVTTWMTDDTARPYQPEDHEQVLAGTLLTLLDLVQRSGDATARCHQLGETVEELLAGRERDPTDGNDESDERKPSEQEETVTKTPATAGEEPVAGSAIAATAEPSAADIVREELAIAPFLRAVVRGESPLQLDDRQRFIRQALEWRPGSRLLMQEWLAASQAHSLAPGTGSVYVVALVGRGPHKEEAVEPVSSQALLAADRILSAIGEHELPPTIAPVRIATVVASESRIDGVACSIKGQPAGMSETLADINRLAVARQEELLPEMIARAVVRRALKKSVIVVSQDEDKPRNDPVTLAWTAAGMLWEATERADLRGWSLLPGQIQILRIDLPAGVHQLELSPVLAGRLAGPPVACAVPVADGANAFVLAFFPDAGVAGQAYASR